MKFLIPKAFRSSVLYVRIRAHQLHVRDTSNGKEYVDEPLVTLPSAQYSQPVNGFDHPRTIIQDFSIAHVALQQAMRAVYYQGRLFRLPPIMVMHPLEKLEGGLTPVEATALLELAKLTGARQAFIWVGRALRDDELQMENILRLFLGN